VCVLKKLHLMERRINDRKIEYSGEENFWKAVHYPFCFVNAPHYHTYSISGNLDQPYDLFLIRWKYFQTSFRKNSNIFDIASTPNLLQKLMVKKCLFWQKKSDLYRSFIWQNQIIKVAAKIIEINFYYWDLRI